MFAGTSYTSDDEQNPSMGYTSHKVVLTDIVVYISHECVIGDHRTLACQFPTHITLIPGLSEIHWSN
jgi:hypothetical protein